MTPTYIGDIDLNEETLAHFGVKGMKWGKRKAKLKSDLKWKTSKLKNKKLELNAKKLRKKKGVRDADDITNDISKSVYGHGHDNGKANSRTSATRNYQYKIGGKTETVTTSEGYSKQPSEKTRQKAWKNYTYDGVSKDQSGPRYKGIQKKYINTTKWEPKTKDERTSKRIHELNTSNDPSDRYFTFNNKKTPISYAKKEGYITIVKDKRKKQPPSYGGGEKWQPKTNAERTAKSNDDFINSKGGQELLKVYKRKKAMSSRKSTKA